MSRPSEPVEIDSISTASRWPSFMMEPLPKARSIWARAASSALFLFSMPSFSTTFSIADIGCLLVLPRQHHRIVDGIRAVIARRDAGAIFDDPEDGAVVARRAGDFLGPVRPPRIVGRKALRRPDIGNRRPRPERDDIA